MKLLIMVLSITTASCFSQNNKQGTIKVKAPSNDEIYTISDPMPVFPGGNDGLLRFMQENLTYPQTAVENGISGTVYVSFTIRKEGIVENVRIIRGIPGCPECDLEVLRLVDLMPAFTPGKKDGVPVSVQFLLPVKFRLN